MPPDPGFACWVEQVLCNTGRKPFIISIYHATNTAPRWLLLPQVESNLGIKHSTMWTALKRGQVHVGEETDIGVLRQLKGLGGLGGNAPRVSMVTVGGMHRLLATLGGAWPTCITDAEALRLSEALPPQLGLLRRRGPTPSPPAPLPAPPSAPASAPASVAGVPLPSVAPANEEQPWTPGAAYWEGVGDEEDSDVEVELELDASTHGCARRVGARGEAACRRVVRGFETRPQSRAQAELLPPASCLCRPKEEEVASEVVGHAPYHAPSAGCVRLDSALGSLRISVRAPRHTPSARL